MSPPLAVRIVCPALLLCAATAGCNNETPTTKKTIAGNTPFAFTARNEKRTALAAKELEGVLRGKVVYDGEPPPPEPIPKMQQHPDKQHCLQGTPGEIYWPTWMVNKENKGVANVVVWLEPPAGKYFSLNEKQKKRSGEEVVIDQPHCAFVPHVASLFPAYFDGFREVQTGQKLVIKNSAPFPHSVQWNQTPRNEMLSEAMPPNTRQEFVLHPEKKPLFIGCGLHNWMHGILWIFDHPYHAVTREDGSFQIDHIPIDVELTFKAWHESQRDPFEQRKITFQKGENPPVELKIKK